MKNDSPEVVPHPNIVLTRKTVIQAFVSAPILIFLAQYVFAFATSGKTFPWVMVKPLIGMFYLIPLCASIAVILVFLYRQAIKLLRIAVKKIKL